MFEEWRNEHGYLNRFTETSEYLKRLAIFAENVEKIEAHNAKELGWTMAVNEFAHLSATEFKEMYTGVNMPKPEIETTLPRVPFVPRFAAETPASVDWSDKGA